MKKGDFIELEYTGKVKDMDFVHKLMREDMKKSIFNLPTDILKHKLQEISPDATEEEINKTIEYDF